MTICSADTGNLEQIAKACLSCGEVKSLDEFHRHPASLGGRHPRCKACRRAERLGTTEKAKRCQEAKVLREQGLKRCPKCDEVKSLAEGFYKNPAARSGYGSECKGCVIARAVDRNRKNPEAARERERRWAERHPEEAKASARKRASTRRARVRDLFVEHIDPRVVFQRDEGICGICNVAVPVDEYDVDHVIPLVEGGAHAYANVRLAHVSCNRRRNFRRKEK